jgi:hypothetical protein
MNVSSAPSHQSIAHEPAVARATAPHQSTPATTHAASTFEHASPQPSAKPTPPQVGDTFSKEGVTFVVLGSQPRPGAAPVVLFNHDETLTAGELSNTWTNVGAMVEGRRPNATSFTVLSAHSNKAPTPMQVGVAFTNTSTQPITLIATVEQVGRIGTGGKTPTTLTPPKPWEAIPSSNPPQFRVTIAAGQSVVLPVAQTAGSKAPNTREPDASASFRVGVTILSGSPTGLSVKDVARHPGSTQANPAWSGDKTHHEGVFAPQMPASGPSVLTAGTGVRLAMPNDGGSPANYAYGVPCQFSVAIPTGTATISLRGVGGKAIVSFPPSNGNRVISGTTPMVLSVADAVKLGLLKPVLDASGKPVTAGKPPSPVYLVNVEWLPGSFAGLDLFLPR